MKIPDYTLNDLFYKKKISRRTYNVLESININSLAQIVEFYLNRKEFLSIKNSGMKTNLELTQLCETVLNGNDFEPENEAEQIMDFYKADFGDKLNPLLKSALELYHLHKFESLSNRSKNSLLKLESTYAWHEYVFTNFDFKTIRNIGEKCYTELLNFKNDLVEYYKTLNTLNTRNLKIELLKNIVIIKTKNNIANNSLNYQNIVDEEGNVKIFYFVKEFIAACGLESNILSDLHSSVFTNNGISLGEIGIKYQLTKERIRQLKIEHFERSANIYNFINLLPKDWLKRYIEFDKSYIICVNAPLTIDINREEEVDFNAAFYLNIFKNFADEEVYGLTDNKYSSFNCFYNEEFGNSYLVKKEIIESFDIKELCKISKIAASEKNNLSNKINLITFISSCLIDITDELGIEMCKTILQNEFDFTINDQGHIFINKGKKRLSDYCFDILEQAGYPLNILEIQEALSSIQEKNKINIDNLRSTLSRYKDLFICFGRTSTYGLKKWEDEFNFIKGGSIRDIVSEYLNKHDKPCHISEITEYVQQFRKNTYDISILRNLMLEESNTFTFYPSNFVGLSSIQYSADKIEITKVVGVHFTDKVLRKYNGKSVQYLIEEYERLYNYSAIQTQSILNNKISLGVFNLNNNIISF